MKMTGKQPLVVVVLIMMYLISSVLPTAARHRCPDRTPALYYVLFFLHNINECCSHNEVIRMWICSDRMSLKD